MRKTESYSVQNVYGYSEYILPLTAYAGLVLPFFVPSIISILIKPIGIGIAILFTIKRKKNVMTSVQKALLLFGYWYLISFARFSYGGSLSDGISYIMYILYAFFYTSILHSDKSVRRLLYCCYYAGFTFALVTAVSNPFFGTNVWSRTYLNMLGYRINSNLIGYVTAIGLSVLPCIVLTPKGISKHWMKHIPIVIVMMYVILLAMGRGAFLCAIATLAVIFFKTLKICLRKSLLLTLFFMCCVATALYIILLNIPEAQMSRLLSGDSYQDSNGRFEMYSYAISTVDNILFGGGVGAWKIQGYGSEVHNLFISLFVETGIIGAGLLAFTILLIMVKIRDLNILSVATPMLILSMVESADSYIFWIPFITTIMLIQNKSAIYAKS